MGAAELRSFERVPVPLVEADLSEVRALLEARGFFGIELDRLHLEIQPDLVEECLSGVALVRANEHAVRLLGADAQTVLRSPAERFRARSAPAFRQVLVGLRTGALPSRIVAEALTDEGARLDLALTWSPLEGDRVLIAIEDVTPMRLVRDQQVAFRRVLHRLAAGAPAPAVLRTLASALQDIDPEVRVAVYAADGDGRLRALTATGLSEEGAGLEGRILAQVLRTHAQNRPDRVIVDDVGHRASTSDYRYVARCAEMRTLTMLPLMSSSGHALGLLVVYHRRPEGPERREFELAESFAHLAAVVLECRTAVDLVQLREARLRSLVETSSAALLVVDVRTGRGLEANHAAVDLLGYPDRETLLAELRDLDHYVRPAEREALLDTLRVEPAVRGHPLELRRRNGTACCVEVSARLRREQGTLEMMLVDVTERRDTTDRLHRLETQLRQRQRLESIGTLASGIAHEVNTPLLGIRGFGELVRQGVEPASEAAGWVDEILQQADRIESIIQNLLTFARHGTAPQSACDLRGLIDGTLSLVNTVLRDEGITLEVDVPADLPPVRCHAQQIQQVVMNLVTNARDAVSDLEERGRRVIRIVARSGERQGRYWLRLTVEDQGPGVPPEIVERIFDPFFTTKEAGRGTGLGLSVSHRIVSDHGGSLTVESQPGRWTRFHVDLPADTAAAAQEAV